MWTCSNCQQPQNGAGKKISLWNVPDVLVLHLKRFKQVNSEIVEISLYCPLGWSS